MVSFKSIAVLDLETTSLPANDFNTTRITELALMACEIDHVKHSKEFPRVLHKLILLFNPRKIVYPEATRKSGLCNELLMNINPFSEEDAEALSYFLTRLPGPVCIVAHNGNKFDFPILRKALKKVNKNLPENVYCADSLKAFRQLLPKSRNERTPSNQRTQPMGVLPTKTVTRKLFRDGSPQDLDDQWFPNNREFSEWVASLEFSNNREFSEWLSSQEFPNNREFSEWAFSLEFPNHREFSEWVSNQKSIVSFTGALPSPKSYRLRDIYHHFFNSYFADAHTAEEDSKALLNCIIRCDGFWEWMSKNCVTFNSIPPLF